LSPIDGLGHAKLLLLSSITGFVISKITPPWPRRYWVSLENLNLRPRHLQFFRKDIRLDQVFVANNIGSYPTGASEAVIAAAAKK